MENPVARVSEESGEARLRTSQLLDAHAGPTLDGPSSDGSLT
jgi:hypothetical protein